MESKKADKLWKKTLRDQQKRIKPGECQKYVRLIVDAHILSTSIGQDTVKGLDDADLKYEIRNLPEPQCILWERSVGQRTLKPTEDLAAAVGGDCLNEEWQMENICVRLLSAQALQTAIQNQTLSNLGERLHAAFPNMRHTLVVPRTKDKSFNTSAALIEFQLVQQCPILQLPPGPSPLIALLRRFTKSIAEAPYKQQKAESMNTFKKYLANDKKQCVRVEGTAGVSRLWQQHLNRMPQVTLEVAETIIAEHSCPSKLLAEFKRSGEYALAELKINRGGVQPLQTDRRIGSKTAYNSDTGGYPPRKYNLSKGSTGWKSA